MSPLLAVSGLSKRFRRGDRAIAAVDAVDLTLERGETLALVGPSGSGKSTLARLVLRLVEPDRGTVHFAGVDFLALAGARLRAARAGLQMVFQDPLSAFNPRATVGSAIADPLRIHGLVGRRDRPRAVAALLERVGLPSTLAARSIHEISGGQCQRVAIARALAPRPSLIVLDEALSALDVSVRGDVLSLLSELQRDADLGYLFISHDLGVVNAFADRVAVMDAGRIVETGPAREVIRHPRSATAQALKAAVPRLLPAAPEGTQP